jgi:hypothetical protein
VNNQTDILIESILEKKSEIDADVDRVWDLAFDPSEIVENILQRTPDSANSDACETILAADQSAI